MWLVPTTVPAGHNKEITIAVINRPLTIRRGQGVVVLAAEVQAKMGLDKSAMYSCIRMHSIHAPKHYFLDEELDELRSNGHAGKTCNANIQTITPWLLKKVLTRYALTCTT